MGTGTGTGTSQPTPPARGAPASSRPRCQPQSRLAHMPPQGFRNSQPPLPRQRGGGHRAHLQLPWRTWVAVGSPSAGTAAGHHHRASSALLPPASKIRPRQCWVSVEVLSLRACCRQRSALAHGTHVQQHAKGTPLLQVLGHRSLPALSEQGCTPKPSSVPRRAHAIRGQAAGWHCQPHPLATPVPPRPAHPGAHPVGSAGMNHGNPPRVPGAPQAGMGTACGTSLTLLWHLVWQESLQPAGGRGERGLVGAGEGALLGAAHGQPTCRAGGVAPHAAGHGAPWHGAQAAGTCNTRTWMPTPCTRTCTLRVAPARRSTTCTCLGRSGTHPCTRAVPHLRRCQRAGKRACVQTPVPRG